MAGKPGVDAGSTPADSTWEETMIRLFAVIFVGMFAIQAIQHPWWALWAYPMLGLLMWGGAAVLGFTLPFWRTIVWWLPDLMK